MTKQFSIRKKLIISICLGCLFPFLIGSLYIKQEQSSWLYDNNVENANVLLSQTADHVDHSVLKLMENLASMIAMDERIINVGSDINSYVDFGSEGFALHNFESERLISSYFRSIVESHDIVSFVSLGTETGGYIEYPPFNPTNPYDPRVRAWYMGAILKESAIISEPYITKITKDLVVSVDKTVVANEQKIGVISMTVSLDDLMKNINTLHYGKTGYIDILSPNNVFINSPANPGWVLRSTYDLDLDIYRSIDSYNGKSFEGQINSVDKVFNVYISPYSGWKYISVIDKSEVLARSKSLSDILLYIYIATFLIVFALLFLISGYITHPILKLAQSINKMATFQFDLYEHKEIISYTNQGDEIGEISRALRSMQQNFIELKNKVTEMDQEIQHIDIDVNSTYQMKLSKDNPFFSISYSVNVLLKKVQSYIEQIHDFNKEISDKNELLSASEEELTAQLEEINFQKEQIYFLADHDPLTDLPNRRCFSEKLHQVLSNESSGAVLLLDLDNFKGINDTLGHPFGDKVLQCISGRLSQLSGSNVFVSRFGGDEFLILFENHGPLDQLPVFIAHLFEVFSVPFMMEQIEIKLAFSMGIARFPQDSRDIESLIMQADLALYDAKNHGKNDYAYFNHEMALHMQNKQVIKKILLEALEDDGFKMVYQPQVDISTFETAGYEALVRLKNHALSPTEFIQIAEEDGLIIPLGRIVTKKVIEQLRTWIDKGLDVRPVSINFSVVQIHDTTYSTYLFELLEAYNIDPRLIVLEITENIFLENKETTLEFITALRSQGIKIAVDDFGTGYSSLSYLTFLPIDTLKLDRLICTKFLEHDNLAVMDSLISLAHSLKLNVVAEGIETETQVHRLIVGKCDVVQGYYFSHPLEVEDVESTLGRTYSLK